MEVYFTMLQEGGHKNTQPKKGVAVLKRLRTPVLYKAHKPKSH